MVEKPNPLIIDPEKFVRTPLGTLEPNIAIARDVSKGKSRKIEVAKNRFSKI
jgi:hypothetical protein